MDGLPVFARPRAGGLEALRARVRAIGRGGAGDGGAPPAAPLGVAALDRALPGGGLARGRVHEIAGEGRAEVRDAAPFGLAAALARRLLDAGGAEGAAGVLWCPNEANPFGGALSARGLAWLGLDPGRVLVVDAPNGADRLWAVEEALGRPGLAAVVAEAGPARPGAREGTVWRRLRLAAAAGGAAAILVRPGAAGAAAGGGPDTRWRVRAAPSAGGAPWPDEAPRWRIELLRARNGRPAAAEASWDPAAGAFRDAVPALAGPRAARGADESSGLRADSARAWPRAANANG